ncbi:MAG TPA: MFS transporter [Solirubrobacteraceae bacterium]|nr:MFS transporter [Solirubrobacteraceae bacterium]
MLNPTTPFRIALRERNLRLLLTGLAASQAGDWLYNLALLAFVYDRTHSSLWVGASTAARILPEVLVGPLAGVVADRTDRRLVMLGSDFARALAMALLAAVAVLHAPIVFAPLLAALSTAAGSAYPQCVVAVMPALATEEQLPAANAARVSVMSICIVAGPLFGALLLLLGSPAIAFALNGATFLAGAAVVAALPRRALAAAPAAERSEPAGLVSEHRAGWLALRDYRDAVPVVGANLIASTVYGALTVLFVILGHRLGLGAAGYGYLLAGMGAGGLLAAGLAGRGAASGRPRQVLSLAVVAVGAPLPLLAIAGWLPAALVLAGIFGAGSIVTEVVGDTCLQRSLDPSVFARAYGLVVPVCVGGIAVGALLAPILVSLLGVSGALAVIGGAVVAYALLLARTPRPALAPLATATNAR